MEEFAPGSSKYVCTICGDELSRKQRLISHRQIKHGILPEYVVQRYKGYSLDPSIPVPRTTEYRNKVQIIGEDCAHSYQYASCSHLPASDNSSEEARSSLPVVSEYVGLSQDFTFNYVCADENQDEQINISSVQDVSHTEVSSESNQDITAPTTPLTVDQSSEDDSESDTTWDSDSDCSISTSNESDTEDEGGVEIAEIQKTLNSRDQFGMLLLSFIMKHRLSGEASSDMLELLRALNIDYVKGQTLASLKQSIGACNAKIIDFCEICGTLFPESIDIVSCEQTECNGLRFKGPISKQHLRRRSSYFACMPIEQQIKNILEREGVWQTITQYREKCLQSDSISDILNGEMYRELCEPGNFLSCKNNITLMFNTDGVPLYKSSGISIWPVYLVINELPPVVRFSRRNAILWGVWQARGKPNFQTFFQPFIKEMQRLQTDGIQLHIEHSVVCCKATLLAGTLDLQAKAILVEMTPHNGQYGCLTCEEPGVVVKQGKGHARVYPPSERPAALRTTEGILQCGVEAMSSTAKNAKVKGIKSVSCLHALPSFDIVNGLVPDYMHGVLLGVTKQMLNLHLSSANSKKPFFVGHHIKEIDRRLMNMKPTDQVSRLPRKLEKNMAHLKASELHMWLLFYCLPCLFGLIAEEYLDHIALLVEGVYILLGDNISQDKLARAEYVLSLFYHRFPEIYGINNVTLNIHNLCQHVVTYVRKLGPLWAWSCFPFEDMNGTLLQHVHGTGDVCMQILWTVQAQKRLALDFSLVSDGRISALFKNLTSAGRSVKVKAEAVNCKIAGGLVDIKLDHNIVEEVTRLLGIQGRDIGMISKAKRIIIGESVFFCEEYTRMFKRIGNIVLISTDSGFIIGSVKYYILHHNTNTCLAVVKKINIANDNPLVHPLVHHLIRITPFNGLDDVTEIVVAADNIKEKMLLLDGNNMTDCIARLPNLFGQCS